MSGILELRTMLRADGTQELAYRIGTRDWVDVTSFDRSVAVENSDGTWTIRYINEIGGGSL